MAEEELKQEELPLVDEKPAEAVPDKVEETVEVAAEETPAEVKEPEAEPEKPDWRDKELKAKHRQNKDLERRLAEERNAREAAEAINAKFNQGKQEAAPPGYVPATEVSRLAAEERAKEKYIEQCNIAANAGEKTFGADWKEAIENLELKGGFDEQTMRGILATARRHGTEAPAKILFELGKDPNRYDALMALPYEERIIEMADLVRQPATKTVSSAPAPVAAIGGKAAPAGKTLSDGQTDDEWYSVRMGQKRKRWESRHSPSR